MKKETETPREVRNIAYYAALPPQEDQIETYLAEAKALAERLMEQTAALLGNSHARLNDLVSCQNKLEAGMEMIRTYWRRTELLFEAKKRQGRDDPHVRATQHEQLFSLIPPLQSELAKVKQRLSAPSSSAHFRKLAEAKKLPHNSSLESTPRQ